MYETQERDTFAARWWPSKCATLKGLDECWQNAVGVLYTEEGKMLNSTLSMLKAYWCGTRIKLKLIWIVGKKSLVKIDVLLYS